MCGHHDFIDLPDYYDDRNYCPMGCPYFMSYNDSPDCLMYETTIAVDNYAGEAIRCTECMKEAHNE